MRRHLGFVLAVLLVAVSARADVKLHGLFNDNMVLQREMPVPVWGTAEAGEQVTVTFGDQKKTATADKDGNWMVKLDPLKAGGPFEMTVAGKNSLTVKNILVGEVWVCSGQSNMEMAVKGVVNADAEIAAAKFSQIRLYTVTRKPSDTPLKDLQAQWKECTPENIPGFSAVGYFFGRDIHKALNVPVGLIHTSWGGTAAELWTRRAVLENLPETKLAFENYQKAVDNFPKVEESFKKAEEAYKANAAKLKADGKTVPPAPRAPRKPMMPSCLYNGMIAPLIPYAIRGATWYQGESNAGNAKAYASLFPAMIKNWREDWGQGDFPFLFVQLANYMARAPQPGGSNWAALRESQTKTLSLPKTGMAVIIDIGEEKDIHPKNKQDVGKRLALAGLKVAYGKDDIVYSGPMYESMKEEGGAIRLSFKHVGGGLVAKGGEKLTGFAVAGEDKKWVWADAKIDGTNVVVSSASVSKPVAVRYAWGDNPECNLYNKEDIPAVPFRTDDWER
jgi:sialate O-acetylesterase